MRTAPSRWLTIGTIVRASQFIAAFLIVVLLPSQAVLATNRLLVTTLPMAEPSGLARSLPAGDINGNQTLHVAVSLPYANPAAVQAFVNDVSNPKSPNYRHFLTPAEVGTQFGLPSTDVQAVQDYLRGAGMSVTLVAKNRLSILANATAAQAEAAFHTTINNYTLLNPPTPSDNHRFSYSTAPRVPADLAPYIQNIDGLENFTQPQIQALTATQVRTLYSVAPLYSGGDEGQGMTVGISSYDGYRLTNVPLYYSEFGLPTPPGGVGSNITVETIDGGQGGGTVHAEGDVDMQMVLGMAPLANLIIYDSSNGGMIDTLTREVNDNSADIITDSYGWNLASTTATAAHNLHLSMSAQGITYMAATGDSGTTIEPYSYPDYDPEVLAVGGTAASVDGSGNRTSEVGWSGSGGGWSTNAAAFNTLPSYQVGTGVPTNINYRLVPDVALHATGMQFYLNGSLTGSYQGTSFAAPVFAGALADVEQQLVSGGGSARLGRLQDLIYSQDGRSDVWYDVTSGSNGTLPNSTTSTAGVGWDFVTGWGAINFNAFEASINPNFSLSASPSRQAVTQGLGTSYTVSSSVVNGFSASEALTISGLPSGANGSFSPSSITGAGSSTLTITTSNSTPSGDYTVTITGTYGSLVNNTTLTLSIGSSIGSNDLAAATVGTYDDTVQVSGTKSSNTIATFDGQTIADTDATSWQVSLAPAIGTTNYTIDYINGDDSLAGSKTITVVRRTIGDINGDGQVNVLDLSLLFSHWDQTVGNPDWTDPGNTNNWLNLNPSTDSVINILDLSLMFARWSG